MNKENIFLKIFEEKQDRAKERLEDYLKNHGIEQVHDLRTSIRRLEATYLILPKSCKTKKTDNFVSSYKSLFRKNRLIRDSDVIIEKLTKNTISEDSGIIQSLIKRKEKKLNEAIKAAKKSSKLKKARIKEIDPKKIISKYDRKIFSLIEDIQNHIPIVAHDESKVAELHSMRKIAKKLRYVLEIDPKNSHRHMIESMKSFQDLLGKIHDCDITIIFLKKHSKKIPELDPILEKEQVLRGQIYKKLATNLTNKK